MATSETIRNSNDFEGYIKGQIKMATSKTIQKSNDFEEYIIDLLECPVCTETIKSVPVYQCTNGHVICKNCIEKLNNCPICRNDSALVRNLKLENIVQRLEGIQPENEGHTTATRNLQKWGQGSVRSYGTIDGPNQEALIEPSAVRQPSVRLPSVRHPSLEPDQLMEKIVCFLVCLIFVGFIFCITFCNKYQCF